MEVESVSINYTALSDLSGVAAMIPIYAGQSLKQTSSDLEPWGSSARYIVQRSHHRSLCGMERSGYAKRSKCAGRMEGLGNEARGRIK